MDAPRAAPYNPRKIDKEALQSLKRSLSEFGDLGVIVVNDRTGHVVSGHQRIAALAELHGAGLAWSADRLTLPDGTAFPVRRVDWPEGREKLANIAANNPLIQGAWDQPILDELIVELTELDPALVRELRIDALLTPNFDPDGEIARMDEKSGKVVTCPKCGHEFKA